ncbi:hypothetical protein Hamer_G024438, partial [Homarus americanus]
MDPVLPTGPCGKGETGQASASTIGAGGLDAAPSSSLSQPSSFTGTMSAARPSLSTVKLLNTVTFETIESGTDKDDDDDDDECLDSSMPTFRSNLLTATASETVDSGIGNDELGAENSISRFLSRSDDSRIESSDTLSETDVDRSSFRFSFRTPLSQKPTELTSPASDVKAFTWNSEHCVSTYATTQSSPTVTLVTTKFASLSVSSPDKELPCKSFPETSSPSATPSSGIFNIKLLKENLLRESEGLDPLQPSPNLEDSSSTCSYLTLSGSSGFFSKSNATDEVPSPKTSPTAETEYPTEVNGDVPSSTFSFLRSPARSEPTVHDTPSLQEATTDVTDQPSSTESFGRTRFSFLTKAYLPPMDSASEENGTTTELRWSPSSEKPISSPTSGFTFSFSRTSEASATTLTSATVTPVVTSSTASPPPDKSRFFSFLNLRHSPESVSPPSPSRSTGEKVSPPGSSHKLKPEGKDKVCDAQEVKDEKSDKLLSEKIRKRDTETNQSGEQKKDLEETEAQELQRKLEILNHIMDQETLGAPGATRNPQLNLMSGMSEDSDYKSDVNYPVGQHPNSSASQFLAVANQMSTPQRSLETSRENSYEMDDGGGGEQSLQEGYSEGYDTMVGDKSSTGYYDSYTIEHNRKNEGHASSGGAEEDLFYNSRPNNRKDYSPVSSYYGTYDYASTGQGATQDDTAPARTSSNNGRGKLARGTTRRPSLERQTTLYDDQGGGTRGDGTSRENRYSNYHSYYHQYSSSQEETSAPTAEGEYGYEEKTPKDEQADLGYQNDQEATWYDKDRTEGYYGEYGKECSKDEGYQNDKNDDGYAGEQYDTYGYDQYGQYEQYDQYYGYGKSGEIYDYSQYGYYGEDGGTYYQNYDGYYGYYDEAGVFHNYNENYNYAYRSNEHLDSSAEVQGDGSKVTDASKMITAPSSLASAYTTTTSAITTTKALSSVLTTTTSSSTTTKPLGNHRAAQQKKQQQSKPASGGFGLFSMNKKGGLFNAMSGITSKVSDTLNTAVKEVSATAAAAAQQANVAAHQTTKAATAKATAAAKSAGVVGPHPAAAAAQKAATPQTVKPPISGSRVTLTKQESVRSDKMPGDEAERRSLATLPETSDLTYQTDSLEQTSPWQQETYETAHTDKTQHRQDSFETAPEGSIYDEEEQGQDDYYDDYYDEQRPRRHYDSHDPYYEEDYYDDDRRSRCYEYDDYYRDSFENDEVSSIVDTERGLPRYPSQGSEEIFPEGDGQYSTEYESGTESRENVNARIEPYPGDLSKAKEEKPKESKIIDFDMKTRTELAKAESDTTKSGPSTATLNRPAEQVNRQRSFEEKMRQMKGILKLPALPTSLPTSLPIKIPDLTRASVPKPQDKLRVLSSQPAREEQVKETEQLPVKKVTQQTQPRPEPAVDQAKKASFEEKMKMLQKPSSEPTVGIQPPETVPRPTEASQEVLSDPSRTGSTLPEQTPAQKQPASEDALQPDQQITGPGPASADAGEAEGPSDAKLTPLTSSEERHVSFEEDGGVPGEEGPPKKKMNARERWYWAFNKIVGELNFTSLNIENTETT